jgi:hypothetical protein
MSTSDERERSGKRRDGGRDVQRLQPRAPRDIVDAHNPSTGVTGGTPADAPASGRNGRLLFALGVVGAVVLFILRVLPGLQPVSFYLDDQWVLNLVRDARWSFVWTTGVPTTPGFILLLKLAYLVPAHPHLTLQIVPVLAAIGQVILVAVLTRQVTGSRSMGVLAAMLLALNVNLGTYAVRAKHFTLDGLLVLGVLALAWRYTRAPGVRRLLALAAACVVFPAFSFPTLFVAVVAVNVCALHLFRTMPAARTRAALITVLFNVAAAAWVLFVKSRTNPGLNAYWQPCYLPITSGFAALREYFHITGVAGLSGVFPSLTVVLAFVAALGAAAILKDAKRRTMGIILVLFFVEAVVLSAARRYPLGGGRTDIYWYPVMTLLACCGLTAATRAVARGRHERLVPAVAGLVLVTCLILGRRGPEVAYPETGDRGVIEAACALVNPGDAVLIEGFSNYAVACYAPWDSEPRPVNDSTNGFSMFPKRERTYVIPESFWPQASQDYGRSLPEWGERLLAGGPDRVIVINTMGPCFPNMLLAEYMRNAGYGRLDFFTDRGAMAIGFQRMPKPAK